MRIEELLYKRDVDLEKAVISKIITSGQIIPGLSPEYFDSEQKKLFAALWDQWNVYGEIDAKMLRKEFGRQIEDCLDLPGISSQTAISKLRELWQCREYARIILSAKIGNESSKDIAKINEQLAGVLINQQNELYDHHAEIRRFLEYVEKKALEDKTIRGYGIGIESFDYSSSGIERGKFYVLGGLKKTGKSRFMAFMAIRLIKAGAGVHINSLEMNSMQLNSLAVAYYSGINSSKLGTRLTKEQFHNLAAGIGYVHNLNWTIYKDHTTIDLKTRIIFEKQKRKVDVVFVDFIQRMRNSKYKNDRVREVESVSQDLADIARDQDVAIIALSQLSGRAEHLDKDEIPDMSHLKESQGIAENADTIIILHNSDRHENPFTETGGYKYPKFKIRIEQRYDISGNTFEVLGDMRTCRFRGVTPND